jgi:porin
MYRLTSATFNSGAQSWTVQRRGQRTGLRLLQSDRLPLPPGISVRGAAVAAAVVLAVSAVVAGPVHAQAPTDQGDLLTRMNLLGSLGGLRSEWADYGLTFGLQETSEVLGNLTGGVRTGATYDGLTQLTLTLDTQKAFGWAGGTFNLSALQLHGRSLSQYNLENLQTDSGISGDPATRLWELWYQQQSPDNKFDIKVGQQSVDQEFMVSQYALSFVNTMFGWPALPSYDMPAGGPAYPLSALGGRLRVEPTDRLTLLAGAFDGNPAGTSVGDPQQADPTGTNFDLHSGVLAMAEAQYAINQTTTPPGGGSPAGLPGTYRFGAWYNSNRFADQNLDTSGLSLANPLSNGIPVQRSGDFSIYAVTDQMIWRPSPDSMQSVGVFGRAMVAPGDRNLVSFSANAGLVVKAPLPGRDNDTFGIGLGYAQLGSSARAFEQATATFNPGSAVHTGETYLEVTYQYQVAPWWTLQPDFQYTFNPINPNNLSQRIRNEAVVGVRTNIVF